MNCLQCGHPDHPGGCRTECPDCPRHETLRIADHTEWWIIMEDGYGAHDIVYRGTADEDAARRMLGHYRDRMTDRDREVKRQYHVQEIAVHREAKVLDW